MPGQRFNGPRQTIAPFDTAQANEHQEQWAAYLKVPVEYTSSIGMKFVLIPPGEFTMGSPAGEEDRSNVEEQVSVTLTRAIQMSRTEVTQGQWRAVMGTEPWKGQFDVQEGDDYAATYVSWDEAVSFCEKLSAKEGKGYRLPTEAEWEWACRSGSRTAYSFGGSEGDLGRYAWFRGNTHDIGEKYAHRVGQKLPNGFGLSDMHGNVWEWCGDWHGEKLVGGSNPVGASSGSIRSHRGGSWYDTAGPCRSAYRSWFDPSFRHGNLGFRLALSPSDAVKAASGEGIPPVTSSNTSKTGWHGWPADAPKPAIAPFDAAQGNKHQEEWAAYLKVPAEFTNTIGMKLRLLPPGEFLMGSPAGEEGRRDDETQVSVTLTRAFQLSRTEVTQGQWRAVMGTEPWKGQSDVQEGDDYAATYVSWEEAVSFCEKLSAKEGKGYRLPTEAEWEWACRSGSRTAYSFGGSEGDLGRFAWFRGNAADIGEKYAHRVGQKLPNGFGLSDMHGNTWEWCGDWYGEKRVGGSNPVGASSGSNRVYRGGGWDCSAGNCRSAYRFWIVPLGRHYSLGFRLALSPSGN